MKVMSLIYIAAIVFAGFLLTSSRPLHIIDEQEAIKLAEDFVKRNGYTKAPVDTLVYKLSYELFDQFENSIKSIVKKRHNTLQPKAFCILHSGDVWHIGFLRPSVKLNGLDSASKNADLPGRCVIVKDNGTEMRIEHKMPLFSHFRKL
jgi:hypothetical protein